MISGFQSREFGLRFGDCLSSVMLSKINQNRKGKKYIYVEDAKLIGKDEYKQDLLILDKIFCSSRPFFISEQVLYTFINSLSRRGLIVTV